METTRDDKKNLLEGEIHTYNNTIFLLGERAQIFRITKNEAQEKACETEITNCLMAIKQLTKRLEEVRKGSVQ